MSRRHRTCHNLIFIVDNAYVIFRENGFWAVEQLKSFGQHSVLKFWVRGNTQRPSEGEIAPEASWRRCCLYLTLNGTKCNSGHALSFEKVCERTHGTGAKRSDGCQ